MSNVFNIPPDAQARMKMLTRQKPKPAKPKAAKGNSKATARAGVSR